MTTVPLSGAALILALLREVRADVLARLDLLSTPTPTKES